MSVRTSSIADVLKNSSTRRSVPAVEESYDGGEQETEYDHNDSQYGYDEERPSEQNDESRDYDEPTEPTHPVARQGRAARNDTGNARQKSTRGDDLIGRLNRLSQERPETAARGRSRPPEDDETHRATSRQKYRTKYEPPKAAKRATNSQYASAAVDNEEWSEKSEEDSYNEYSPRQSSSRAQTNTQHRESVDDEYPERQSLPFRTSRRSARRTPEPVQKKAVKAPARQYHADPVEAKRRVPATPVLSRGRRAAAPPATARKVDSETYSTYRPRATEPQGRKPRQPRQVEPDLDEEYFEERPVVDEQDEKSRDQNSSDVPVAFTALSKTAITAASKYAGVHSMEAGVYEPIKQLTGQFVYNVLLEASRNGSNEKLSSQLLEPAVERVLGRGIDELGDLSESFVNNKSFLKWIDSLTSSMGLTLWKEAIMFLEQCVDFYLVELLANAKELVSHQGRSRLTVDHIQMASRMR